MWSLHANLESKRTHKNLKCFHIDSNICFIYLPCEKHLFCLFSWKLKTPLFTHISTWFILSCNLLLIWLKFLPLFHRASSSYQKYDRSISNNTFPEMSFIIQDLSHFPAGWHVLPHTTQTFQIPPSPGSSIHCPLSNQKLYLRLPFYVAPCLHSISYALSTSKKTAITVSSLICAFLTSSSGHNTGFKVPLSF